MGVKFTPQSEEDIERELLIPEGEYDFQIVTCIQKISKSSGNDMFEVDALVFHEQGQRKITDYILIGQNVNAWARRKLNRLCRAVGLEQRYNTGELDAMEFEGRTGRCKVGIEEAQNGYNPKNKIADYIVPVPGAEPFVPRDTPERQFAAAPAGDEADSQIPF